MQASIDRYLRQKNYPDGIISRWEFKKSQETLNSKAKRPNRAQPYSRLDEGMFWTEDKLGNHNGVALTNVNFKNLSEHVGFRGRQDHYNAYVEDFTILQMADGGKVVQFEENPTKTRQGDLRNKTRSSPHQMWCTDSGEREPVKLFEEWLKHRPETTNEEFWTSVFSDNTKTHHQCLVCQIPNGGASHGSNNEIRRKLLSRRLHEENH